LRTGFVRGRPIHDPWRYYSARLVASGEADCVMWASAFDGEFDPPKRVDIALCAAGRGGKARVIFDVARPGVDGDSVLYDPRIGALVVQRGGAANTAPTVGATLAAIRARLESRPC
jgi:formylmethanofuran dehydrogenase subunit B